MKSININDESANQRLDKYLMKYLNDAPKGFIYKMLRKKNIKLNGAKAIGNEMLSAGDLLEIFLAQDTLDKFCSGKDINLSAGDLDILFEDENIIAVNKPAGILTHAASPRDNDTMSHRFLKYLSAKDESLASKESVFTPAFCNRLDRNTSGIIIGGKNAESLRQLSFALKEREIRRFYSALVLGEIYKGGSLTGFYYKDKSANTAYISKEKQKDEKRVALNYEPEICKNGFTLVKIELLTGKSHQIRAQMADFGYPLAGDLKYMKSYAKTKVKRSMLHARAVIIGGMKDKLSYLNGREITAHKPEDFSRCQAELFK